MRALLVLMTSVFLLSLSSAKDTGNVPFEAVKGRFEASRLALKTLVMQESIFSHSEGPQRPPDDRQQNYKGSEESPRCVVRGDAVFCNIALNE